MIRLVILAGAAVELILAGRRDDARRASVVCADGMHYSIPFSSLECDVSGNPLVTTIRDADYRYCGDCKRIMIPSGHECGARPLPVWGPRVHA